jgi:hypothetical protein
MRNLDIVGLNDKIGLSCHFALATLQILFDWPGVDKKIYTQWCSVKCNSTLRFILQEIVEYFEISEENLRDRKSF